MWGWRNREKKELCGCVGVWVCRCVGVWVCGCVGVWVCECVSVWACGCVGVKEKETTGTNACVMEIVCVWVNVRESVKVFVFETTSLCVCVWVWMRAREMACVCVCVVSMGKVNKNICRWCWGWLASNKLSIYFIEYPFWPQKLMFGTTGSLLKILWRNILIYINKKL